MIKAKRKDDKGHILKKGESQRDNGTYMYRWTDKQKRRKCIYANSLEELRAMQETITLDSLQGIRYDTITLSQMVEKYLETKVSLAGSTMENYLNYYNRCIKSDSFGMKKVRDIRKTDVLAYYARWSRRVSNGTIHILNKIIHPALQLAVDDDIIRKNPSDGCMKEYPVEDEVKYALTFSEENEFLERIRLDSKLKHYYPFFAILLYSGLRISEAIGLTWNDINLQERTINVNHQLQYRKINGKTKWYCVDERNGKRDTKTKSGVRIISMTPQMYNLFVLQQKEWLKMNKDTEFIVDGYSNFVFLSHRTGRPLYPNNIRRMMRNIVSMNSEREIQLPDISPHILRHTLCTRMSEAGMDIKTIQYILGQKDIRTTYKVYNHVDSERVERELEKYIELQEKYTNLA